MTSSSLTDRFMDKVEPEPMSGCWLWTGSVNTTGYGQIKWNGKVRLAHRVSYEANRGTIPAGLHIDHKCNVRCCVNPDHLQVVTNAGNIRLAFLRGHHDKRISALRVKICKRGHTIEGYNEMHRKDGKRGCRLCYNAKNLRWLRKHRNAI